MWVNFPGPHDPFDPPAELQRLYDGVEFPMPSGAFNPDLDHVQLRRNYAACIEGIDQWIGQILDAVEKRGELENTIVIFSSDHGEMLGDHGIFQKNVPQEGSVHVPLVIAGPGIVEGVVSDALVELVDLSATMLDMAGISVPSDWDSRTLAPLVRGEVTEHRPCQVSMLGQWRSICDGRYKLIERREKAAALYDLAEPMPESRAVDGEASGTLARLHDALLREVGDRWLLPDSM